MTSSDEEFLDALRATFKVEADEHLRTISTALMELEKSPAPETAAGHVEVMFRAAHSLKGAARAVDFIVVESLCQSLEDIFAGWKRGKTAPGTQALDSVHRTVDAITLAMAGPETSRARSPVVANASAAPESTPAPAEALAPRLPAGDRMFTPEDTVRIAVGKLDARLLEAEEMLTAKLTTGQRAKSLMELAQRFEPWRKEWTAIQPDVRALRRTGLGRVSDFLEFTAGHLNALEAGVVALGRTADQDRQLIGKLVDDLLEESKKLLLLPFGTLAAPFPKLVRDLCRDQGKEADLVIRGEEVEIDKRILEEMKDPLIHLLRNSVDHGVEASAERRRSGKPPRATITVAASRINGSHVELVVSDDGAGIDEEKVKASALKGGLLSAERARELDAADVRRLIFQPEVSASPIITRVSGRGLGLAIVRERAEKLGGSVSVESDRARGTRFSILLPSTLATFRGILIEAAERLFVVPTFQVERVARVAPDDVRTVEGRDTISLGGRAVSLVSLAGVLALPEAPPRDRGQAALPFLVLGQGDRSIAFLVDAILDEQEVLVKPLRKPLSRVRNIAGATVLADGRVAPILHVSDLLKSAKISARTGMRAARDVVPAAAAAKSVLVAEDSITSRMLIRGILTSAGYSVTTAVDGLDAFTRLRTEHFDLVVSDVEMPRLNGFDLTARIRADKKLAELPVVLVTALETPDDRERGIEVGADAYIVKSSFDQSDLLEAVRRLV